ncbi:ATP-dependent DNA helicase [Fodinicurvata sediminis]|uniref:ATP-dependent DNA helicase n=1 Tax=Fodinicurvata sediminis TaxID=1121832 RepID=UPI0003B50FA1|nr:ATP-dependent DNA helicase [Fodinicurvata sediminis]
MTASDPESGLFPEGSPRIDLPDQPPPVLLAGVTRVLWLTSDGEVDWLSPQEAARRVKDEAPLVCHARAAGRRLGLDAGFRAYDVLELYAFTRPASFCAPTPRGMAQALGLPQPETLEDQAVTLHRCADLLLRELEALSREDASAAGIAYTMARAGWLWGPWVMQALGLHDGSGTPPRLGQGYRVWEKLGEWSDHAPEPQPSSAPVEATEARARLAELLGEESEERPQQADYASAVSTAFQPRADENAPNLVLAEAGTGVGKTLGYIAPASLWSEKNEAPVWLSTFTRNLQHQLDGELDRLYPQAAEKRQRVVVRKGRENYLCLLNYAERVPSVNGAQASDQAIALGLVARWAARTRSGDMVGGDFPGWLVDLLGRARTLGLADRRGECIHSACEFYRKCYIEKSIRRARRANLVVANHALVLIQAAMGGAEDGQLPLRYVFDEGHHLFDAADAAFSAHLSGQEGLELRRWLLGAENRRGGSASRLRGLKRRLEELVAQDEQLSDAVHAIVRAAVILPGEGWHARLNDGQPRGPCEAFLLQVRRQVHARAPRAAEGYSLESEVHPANDELLTATAELDRALEKLLAPLEDLKRQLARRLDAEAAQLDSDTRRRIEAAQRSLERRAIVQVTAWRSMLSALAEETPEQYVDWLAVDRIEGRDIDVGLHRHWVDPTIPLAQTVFEPAHGALVTSATLTDRPGEGEGDWQAAEARTGAAHLLSAPTRARVPSPFDYAEQTRVFIITDLARDNPDQIAAAVRELFLASGGGALGLFTAINRLKAVHGRIVRPLEEAGLELLAQHLDGVDVSTLIEMFRAEPDSCLLGTDAVRDGVDVPGRALRLIAFDRVPWPRPDLRHKARKAHFGKRQYDEMLTRLRLRQAFGRLVRRADDRGVFVLLDSRMPSRLYGAFPEGVEPRRVGLAEALAETRAFLAR